MTPEQMLDQLNDEGDNAGADYNDGIDGWFGWDVTTVRNSASQKIIRYELSITFTDRDENKTTHTWQLHPKPERPKPKTDEIGRKISPEHANPTS